MFQLLESESAKKSYPALKFDYRIKLISVETGVGNDHILKALESEQAAFSNVELELEWEKIIWTNKISCDGRVHPGEPSAESGTAL